MTTFIKPGCTTATSTGPEAEPSSPAIDGSPVTIRSCCPWKMRVIAPVGPKQDLPSPAGDSTHGPVPPLPPSATYNCPIESNAKPRGLSSPEAITWYEGAAWAVAIGRLAPSKQMVPTTGRSRRAPFLRFIGPPIRQTVEALACRVLSSVFGGAHTPTVGTDCEMTMRGGRIPVGTRFLRQAAFALCYDFRRDLPPRVLGGSSPAFLTSLVFTGPSSHHSRASRNLPVQCRRIRLNANRQRRGNGQRVGHARRHENAGVGADSAGA